MLSRYTQLQEIGHGARSKIVLVVDEPTGQKYALKRVFRRSSRDERFMEQTEIEYEISQQFSHPVLRKSHHLKRIRRWWRLVEVQLLMEYFPGRNLEELMTSATLPQLVTIFGKVAEGLLAMHQAGYLHGDIKPNNILVNSETQEVRVIDFGQSCRIGTIKERVQGTPGYIAPEQVRCQPLDQRTDVFNLGATMYWMLTGKPWPTLVPGKQMRPGQRLRPAPAPAGNGTASEIPIPKNATNPAGGAVGGRQDGSTTEPSNTEWLASGSPKTPEEVNPKVPKALSLLVMECCHDQPANRPRDMREVLNRLALAQPRPPVRPKPAPDRI